MSDPSDSSCGWPTVIEYGYPNADYEGGDLGQWEIAFTCDGYGPFGCGFYSPYDPGDMSGVICADDMAEGERLHREHANNKSKEAVTGGR